MIHFYQRTNDLTEIISQDNYFPFAEIITINSLRAIAFRNSKLRYLYYNLIKDIHSDNKVDYNYSDAFDIVQEVALILYNNIGNKLDTVLEVKNGKNLTVNSMCRRVIDKMTYQTQKAIKTTCAIIERTDGEEPFYELEFNESNKDYTKVDEVIAKLNLKPIELEILNCLMANMQCIEIVKSLNINSSRPWNLKYKLQKRFENISL